MNKEHFHRRAKKDLKELASKLGFKEGTFDIRSNKGGPAVLGEVTLHAESLYIQVGAMNQATVLYRSCKGLKDYCGGINHYLPYSNLLKVEALNCFRRVGSIPHATCSKEVAEAFELNTIPSY